VHRYFDGETDVLPSFYQDRMQRDLGPFMELLPDGATRHDPNAYLHAEADAPKPADGLTPVQARRARARAALAAAASHPPVPVPAQT
jgi:hypothetical protein